MNCDTASPENKTLILLVDDIPDNIRVLGIILKNQGYSLAVATNGKEMSETLCHHLPDLILLDIMLPDADGFELCRNLRQDQRTASVPVIFLTAKTALEDKVKGFEAGAVDYITKPFGESEVLARVRTHLQLKKTKDMLVKYCDDLEKSNRTKDKLFAVIAHDLRSPIATLHSFVHLMKKSDLDEKKRQTYIKHAEQSLDNTLILLDNLLKWAKNQRNEIAYLPEQMDMVHIINKNIRLSADMAKSKGIILKFRGREPVPVYADREMMMTVMRNLISNAIKFTPGSGEVEVMAVSAEDYAEISVADSGIGIDSADLGRLFAADHSMVRRGTDGEKGSGMGLILCKEFVEKNRGRIWAESEIGKGTVIRFAIPKTPHPGLPNATAGMNV